MLQQVALTAGRGFSMLAGALVGLALFGPATTHGPEDTTWQILIPLVFGIIAGGQIWKAFISRHGRLTDAPLHAAHAADSAGGRLGRL